jgi:biopolymer transport protein ExbB
MCRCKSIVGPKWTRVRGTRGVRCTRNSVVPLGVNVAARMLLVLITVGCAVGADDPGQVDLAELHAQHHAQAERDFTERASAVANGLLRSAIRGSRRVGRSLYAWYVRTPPPDRVTWGGMTACAGLGLGVLLERLARLRRHKIIPVAFMAGFLDRLYEGHLDCGEALDHCERNPSPAARVALAAVRRWGRPAADLERAVALAHRVESERLRRNVGTLRRIAVLAPLLGLLGTLFALGRAPEGVATIAPPGLNLTASAPIANGTTIAWGPLLAAALTPLSAGLILATLALVAYDGLLTRIEKLAGSLDRLGAETIDAIALSAPVSAPAMMLSSTPAHAKTPHQPSRRRDRPDESISHPPHATDGDRASRGG